jgi:hypothetical protein
MVEEGAESHLGGEAGCCPFGWWSGTLNFDKFMLSTIVCVCVCSYALNWKIMCTWYFS